MSNLSRFLKENKLEKKNVKYAPTDSFTDEKGNPIEWEIRRISTEENDKIRDRNMKDVEVEGQIGVYRQELDISGYTSEFLATSVVFPNLNDVGLQDSYGVKKASDLIKKLLDIPGDYQKFTVFVQSLNNLDEKADITKAKN